MSKNNKKTEKKASKSNNASYVKWVYTLVFTPILLLFLVILLTAFGVFGALPTTEELENPKSNIASEVFSSDGKIIGKYYVQNRTNAHFSELSPHLVNALVATEDVRYFKHSGVDAIALARVIVKTILGRDTDSGGGSTVSQQLAKNLFPREKLNKFQIAFRKIKEWIIAVKLERNYSKEEIIAMYFNTVDFVNQAVGIRSASSIYFNTTPDSLKLEEAATIVGMLKNPSYFNPKRFTERTQGRRNVVLAQMEKYNFITKAEKDSVAQLPLDMSRFRGENHNTGLAPYFREFIRDELMRWCANHTKPDGSKYNLYKDGLKIYTTINSRMQEHAEAAVREHMKVLQKEFFEHWKGRKNAPFAFIPDNKIEEILRQAMKRSDRYRTLKEMGLNQKEIEENFKTPVEMSVFTWNGDSTVTMSPWDSIRYYKHYLRTALMAVDPSTGFIKAWVGGINHQYFKYDQVYTGKRQVGSTFKPLVYAIAMREGLSPCSEVPNISICIETPSGPWCPDNSSKAFEGSMVSLKDALANSINKVSALLIYQFGVKPVVDLALKLGIKSHLDPVPSICLGTADISLYEMVGANAAFVNQGIYLQPTYITRIEDKNGVVLEEFTSKSIEALDEQTAYLTVELMKGVVEGGTAARLRGRYKLTNPIAGKTGTTQNNSDGWFMGLTPELVAGVWVGCEDRSAHFRTTALGQGANTALPIWGLFMQKIYADPKTPITRDDFKRPENLSVETDCAKFKQEKKNNPIDFNNIDIFQ